MRVLVTRTSEWGDKQPMEGTTKESYFRVDERVVNDPAKIKALQNKYGNTDWWYNDGVNHRVENGHIKRDFEATGWFMDVESFDDLMKIVEAEGPVVVQYSYNNDNLIEIEIYDSYRE